MKLKIRKCEYCGDRVILIKEKLKDYKGINRMVYKGKHKCEQMSKILDCNSQPIFSNKQKISKEYNFKRKEKNGKAK